MNAQFFTSLAPLITALIFVSMPTHIHSIYSANNKYRQSDPPFTFLRSADNVTTVQVGSTAYLHCPVVNLGERQLSWVRRRDWQILTHGEVTFTSDERFQLVRTEEAQDDWILQIKYVQAKDSGIYECQVTSDDGIQSHLAELHVVTPEAFILAEEEYHIERGSALSLVCIIEKATTPPQYVFWYHNDRMVNYDSERGISVTTTPGRKTHSKLFIKSADVSDSGNYTCAPSSSLPASIQVFVSGSEVKPWTTNSCVGPAAFSRLVPIFFLSVWIVLSTMSKSAIAVTMWQL